MDEHVLKGNSAVLKCHIPSFVADYVAVESWISDLGEELFVDMTESTGAAQLSWLLTSEYESTSVLHNFLYSFFQILLNSSIFYSF